MTEDEVQSNPSTEEEADVANDGNDYEDDDGSPLEAATAAYIGCDAVIAGHAPEFKTGPVLNRDTDEPMAGVYCNDAYGRVREDGQEGQCDNMYCPMYGGMILGNDPEMAFVMWEYEDPEFGDEEEVEEEDDDNEVEVEVNPVDPESNPPPVADNPVDRIVNAGEQFLDGVVSGAEKGAKQMGQAIGQAAMNDVGKGIAETFMRKKGQQPPPQ